MLRLWRGSIGFLGALILACALPAACRSGTGSPLTLEPVAVVTVTSQPSVTPTPISLAAAPVVATATPTVEPTSTALSSTPTTTPNSPPPSPTRGDEPEHGRYMTPEPPLPTRTPRPTPTPTPTPFTMCAEGEGRFYFEAGKSGLPLDISMSNARFAFDRPGALYVAVANWVGLIKMEQPFNVGDRYDIEPLRFVEMPDFPLITDLEVQNNVAFAAGGSRLAVINAGWNCYWRPIVEATFPFLVQDVELESERIYVGGSDDRQLTIAVLDRTVLPEIRQLATLTFAPGVWSVVDDQMLTHEPQSATVTITDVADLNAPISHLIQIPLDPEWNSIGQPHLVNDAFSLLVRNQGLVSVSGVLGSELEVNWYRLSYDFTLDGHLAQERQLLIIENFADSYDTVSAIYMALRDSREGFVTAGLYPHFPIYGAYAISDNVVFAFSDYSLIVIDLTEPTMEKIVRTYPLRGRLD